MYRTYVDLMPRPAPQSSLRFPLTQVLGADSHVRILRTLATHGGLLSAPALAMQAALARSSVHEALAVLEGLGVVTATGLGRARLYGLSKTHPLVGPLDDLFEAEAQRWKRIVESLAKAAGRPEAIVAAWLYGSVARGQDHRGSDVDLAVVTEPGEQERMLDLVSQRLQEPQALLAFEASIVAIDTADVRRLAQERDPWWDSLRSDAIVLHGDSPDRLLSRLLRQTPGDRAA
jgi:predicted nucleotidyltransferase